LTIASNRPYDLPVQIWTLPVRKEVTAIKIKEFQKIKGRPLITIEPNATTFDAIQKLIEYRIGALPVCDNNGKLLGIITERDILKECGHQNTEIGKTKVQDVMTKDVVIGIPEDEISYVMEVMTRKQVRHLPVMAGRKLDGIISARDIIEYQLQESRAKVRYLSDYLEVVTAVLQDTNSETET
jgi:CBS domain-containing protein